MARDDRFRRMTGMAVCGMELMTVFLGAERSEMFDDLASEKGTCQKGICLLTQAVAVVLI